MGSPFKIGSECKEIPYSGPVSGMEDQIAIQKNQEGFKSLEGSGFIDGDVILSVGDLSVQAVSKEKWNELWASDVVSLKIKRLGVTTTIPVSSKYRSAVEAIMIKGYGFECQGASTSSKQVSVIQKNENSVYISVGGDKWNEVTKTKGQVFKLFLDQGQPKFQGYSENSPEFVKMAPLATLSELIDTNSIVQDVDLIDESWRKAFQNDIGELGWDNPIHVRLISQRNEHSEQDIRKVYHFLNDVIKETKSKLALLSFDGLTAEQIVRLKLSAFHQVIEVEKKMKYVDSSDFVKSVNNMTYDCDLYGAMVMAVGYEVEKTPWPLRGVHLPFHYLVVWNESGKDRVFLPFDQGYFNSLDYYKKEYAVYDEDLKIKISDQDVEDQFYLRAESYEDLYSNKKASLYSEKGKALIQKKDYRSAEKYLMLAIKHEQVFSARRERMIFHLTGGLSKSYIDLSSLYQKLGESEKSTLALETAFKWAKRTVAMVPYSDFAWADYYKACLLTKRYEEIIQSSEEPMSRFDYSAIYISISTAYAYLGKDDMAFQVAQKLVDIAKDDHGWTSLRYFYHYELKKDDLFIKAARKAAQVNPSDYNWLYLADFYMDNSLHQEALQAYQEALKTSKPEASAYDWSQASASLKKLGALTEAEKALQISKSRE